MTKLILASQSKARQEILQNAGYYFEVKPALIDERSIEKNMTEEGAEPKEIVKSLAMSKAMAISGRPDENLVIGSDQILVFNDRIISKAMTKDIAIERLKEFGGQTHSLISGVCVVQHGEPIFEDVQIATLKMRDFDDDFIHRYADKAGDILTSCVGCYALEKEGVQLFEKIEGDYFTILGMPMIALIGFLKEQGIGL